MLRILYRTNLFQSTAWLALLSVLILILFSSKVNANTLPTGPVNIISSYSNLCLDIGGSSTANGAPAILIKCKKAGRNQNQIFRIKSFSDGYRIVAQYSGKCLDVSQNTHKNNQPIHQW